MSSVPGCPARGPGVIKTAGSGPGWESPTEDVVEGVGSGLVGI